MQLFGTKPCKHYSKLSTKEFAERFCRRLKVSQEHQNIFVKNLALLVNDFIFTRYIYSLLLTKYMMQQLFARSVADLRRDTFNMRFMTDAGKYWGIYNIHNSLLKFFSKLNMFNNTTIIIDEIGKVKNQQAYTIVIL